LVLAVRRALTAANLNANAVQLVIGHGAATKHGDAAEWHAYHQIFTDKFPPVRFHKWCTGHLLGAASLYSVALAYNQMQQRACFPLPYFSHRFFHSVSHNRSPATNSLTALQAMPTSYDCVLICAMGFGGNCAAIILRRTS
ncbi:MAG: hypothetical protein OYH77_08655, partial [Pseudomonadota bacterium]|nr:hypothetical protein [Pseudomonadota bacterium]